MRLNQLAAHLAARLAPGLALVGAAAAQTVHVDANLTTGANDGSSWANAFQGTDGLQAALGVTVPGDQVFVADGTYRTNNSGSRALSFRLQNDVEIYGGFAGGEASPDERPAFGVAPSILTADLNGNDGPNFSGNAENSYHVVRTQGTNASAVLDGFTITGGNSNGSSGGNADRGGGILCVGNVNPTIRNCDFVANRCTFGGGAGYINSSGPDFINCSFRDNVGGAFGGAFDIATGGAVVYDGCWFEGNRASRAGALEIFSTGNVSVLNSVFTGNVATGSSGGGALWIGSGGSTRVRNCTIVGNSSTSQAAGGIRVQGATPTIRNTILWANTGPGGAQGPFNQVSNGANVRHCLVEGGFTGTGNISAAPLFVDQAAGNFRLQVPSPGIDAGDNASLLAGFTEADADGARRRFDEPTVPDTGAGTAPIVDMGAYEASSNIGAVFCAANPNSTGQVGRIDASGSLDLSQNDVTLTASRLPLNAFGFFIASRTRGFALNPGGSAGNLCLSGSIGRYVGAGQILNTGTAGAFSLTLDLGAIPQPTGSVAAVAGESWSFQAWHRDTAIFFATSNFTDGVRLTFQ